jgi:hypothetical protein
MRGESEKQKFKQSTNSSKAMNTQSEITKRRIIGALRSLGTAAAVTAAAFSTFAQTWQTVDDFQYVPGGGALNFGLAVGPSGTIFASGYASDGATYHGLVMASADGGNTWSAPLDDFVYPGSTTRDDGGIVADSAGNLYVAGRYYFSSGQFYRFVRRSTDGGATWSTVDTFAISGPYWTPLAGNQITTDTAGNVYLTEPIYGTWTIRKGIGGTSFSTVDTFSGNVNAVFAHPALGVFAAGTGTITVKNRIIPVWVIRRSLDGGATWSTVDTFGTGANAYGLGADGNGNVYALGYSSETSKGSSAAHWIVRKSSNGGSSWTTVDDFLLTAGGNCAAMGFAADSAGNLFVAGDADMNQLPTHWIVRESVGGTGAWTTVDDFVPSTAGARSHAIAADSLGNVFVGGQGSPTSSSVDWLVRKN